MVGEQGEEAHTRRRSVRYFVGDDVHAPTTGNTDLSWGQLCADDDDDDDDKPCCEECQNRRRRRPLLTTKTGWTAYK